MKNSRVKLSVLLCLFLCFTFLVGCSNAGLSDDFDVDQVKESVGEVISFINHKDSESLLDISNVAMKDALTEDVLQKIYEAIGEGGEFKEIEDMSVGGQKDRNSDEEFAVAVAKAKYKNKNFVYTISFTKQMKLAGLFYK